MLNFFKRASFNKTKEYKKLFVVFLIDSWVDKLAPSLGGLAFFLLLTSKKIPEKTFFIIMAVMVVQFLLMFTVRSKMYLFNFKTVSQSVGDFQIKLGEKLKKLPMGFYQTKNSSDLLKVIVDDHNNVNMTWTTTIQVVSSFLINLLVLILVLPLLDLTLALVLLSLIPISYIFFRIARKRYVKINKQLRETTVQSSSYLLDYVKGLSTLRLFNMRLKEFTKLKNSLKKLKEVALKMELASFPISTFSTSLLFMGTGIVAYVGAFLMESNQLNPVYYIAFLFVANQIYNPLVTVYLNALQLANFKTSVDRIYEFYHYDELKSGNEGEIPNGNLRIDHLNFSYGTKETLKDIELTVKENQIYAIVGKSGCGKTTLLKMLLRYFPPQSPSVFLGDKAIESFEIEKYLSQYGVVFQNAYMFNKSVAYNIGLAKDHATREEIIEAAKMANCHDFIENLEEGYETVIGVNGGKLSAGERQRIAVARAFLKDAKIILMDEPTASLDIENEMLLKSALRELSQDKTVMVISHRLNFIKDVDHIIIMDQGKINAMGNHRELIETNEIYQNLWKEEKEVLDWKI